MTVTLESKIREGQYVDLYVNAVTAGSLPRIISLIIEVKGCWNPSLKTSLETQLAQRYLKGNPQGFGIYLVCWFSPVEWDEEDARRVPTSKETLPDIKALLEAEAQEVNSTARTSIRVFVLDGSLPIRPAKENAKKN